jgi:(1->4)-alpha-D-glucan 1-alpha-D-glucosylmutase
MMQSRAKDWPLGLTATATHDTKRGEDARTRLLALAEIPGEWASAVGRWKILNAPHLVVEGSMRSPSAAFEYMLYQALVGAWPLSERDEPFLERMQAYALKAAREGKQETSWLNPNAYYETGLRTFIERILDPELSAEFRGSLQSFTQRTSLLGALNSLSQITLKATMPGVPDFYQGTEFWDFSLVDPDNRRPVDFAARASALAGLETPEWETLAQNWTDGRIKLAWTRHLLKRRAELTDVFAHGDYQPLEVVGPHRDHVVAFARRYGGDAAIIAVGKSLAPVTQGGRVWPDAEAYDGAIVTRGYSLEGISGNELPLADAFKHLPAAVLKAKIAGRRRRKDPVN